MGQDKTYDFQQKLHFANAMALLPVRFPGRTSTKIRRCGQGSWGSCRRSLGKSEKGQADRGPTGLWDMIEMIEMCKAPRRRNSVSWGIPRTGNKGSLSAEKRNLLPHHKKGWSGTRCFSDFISQRSQFLAPDNEEDAAEAVHQAKVAQQLESEAGGGVCIWRTV